MQDDEALSAAMALRLGATRLARRLRLEHREESEPPLRLTVLGHLYRHGPASPGEIAAAERIKPQSLTRTLTSLEADGFVARQPHPGDGRRSVLAITRDGSMALSRDVRARDAWLAAAMASQLTATEREMLRLSGDLMERLAESPQ